MLNILNDQYDIASDAEFDKVLVDLPFTMYKDLITDQIDNPDDSSINYIEVVLDKFKILCEQYEEDPDTIREISQLNIEFFSHIIDKINTKFDLAIEVDTDNPKRIQDLGTLLYFFFILRFRKNIRRFIYKFINKNKKQLAAEFDTGEKKKDVTTVMFKKLHNVKGKEELLILSELSTIIRTILTTYSFSNEEFVSMACATSSFESAEMLENITSGVINGDFVRTYFDIVLDNQEVIDAVGMHVTEKLVKN